MNKNKIKSAFTLAEVLLTLAIVGIVAAMTIPSLMQNIQDMDTVSRLRKAHSTLQGAVKMYMAQSSITDLEASGVLSDSSIWNELKPYLNVLKDCGAASDQDCLPPGTKIYYLNGTQDSMEFFDLSIYDKAILQDGTGVLFTHSSKCIDNYGYPVNNVCLNVVVDLNGQKAPNTFGKDIFHFLIVKNGMVYPRGLDVGYNEGCNKTGSAMEVIGYGCAAKVLQEGKINY